MAHDTSRDAALQPLAPGEQLRIAHGALSVDIAPAAGGRIAQIAHDGFDWLIDCGGAHAAAIGWGSFPMLPWAGRLRDGRFTFGGHDYRVPNNLGAHAIHGVAFDLPWRVENHTPKRIELSLRLPRDERWPFGGSAHQAIEIGARTLRMRLAVTAGAHAMPCVIGWHPWFRKPDRLIFRPDACYPRDEHGIAVPPATTVIPKGPWDDCFVNCRPVQLLRGGQLLQLTSDCGYWVVYDERADATCVEPQSGAVDGFNVATPTLDAGATTAAWFLMEWL